MTAPVAFDAHQLGLGATGNETWARCVVHALEVDNGAPWDYFVTRLGVPHLPGTVVPGRVKEVSTSSAKRLFVDIPRQVRAARPAAIVAQYTLPAVRIPGVVVVHDLSFEAPEARQWLSPATLLRYRSTIRRSVRRAGAVVVSSTWTRQDLLHHYGVEPERVFVAACAVDPDLIDRLAAVPREPPAIPVVLVVGTVLPRKNLAVVARAVAALRSQGSPAVLRVVGPVPTAGRSVLAALRVILPQGLEVAGAVSQDALVAAYRTSTVLCFPSRFEGFGIPVLEAMAAGLPVIASSATCLPEVVGSAGLLVGAEDLQGWIGALEAVCGPVREDLVAAGLARAAHFRWSDTARTVRAAVDVAVREATG